MKTKLLRGFTIATLAGMAVLSLRAQTSFEASSAPHQSAVIPIEQLGVVAGKQYQGDGLSVTATSDGARLRCAFQRLEGQVTREGLWLSSTTDNSAGDHFRVMAVAVGRTTDFDFADIFARQHASGLVKVKNDVARFIRPGLTEEYSVSVDGVRQDFIVALRPPGESELQVELDVTGAKAEPLVNGARLVLNRSGRKLAYARLRVTDACGQELSARLEVVDANRLAVLVDDARAIYPVRIDPTFSDADWISMGGIPGANGIVYSALLDVFENLYIGGVFSMVGGVFATNVAKWDGNTWSALGGGVNGRVSALMLFNGELIVGGQFASAGGVVAPKIAKWNGTTWSSLGTGMNGDVSALASWGNELYVGGGFTSAGGASANHIAKWNGTTWSAVGTGFNNAVTALTTAGTNLYAGGIFTSAGSVTVSRVAKWDGTAWSPLGLGCNNVVFSLTTVGTNLFAGGRFTQAGGLAVNRIARWDGTSWSALGAGISGGTFVVVYALAGYGNDLYVGGGFYSTGSTWVNHVAKWNGNSWSALDTDVEYGGTTGGNAPYTYALAVNGAGLFVGGDFTYAGQIPCTRIAKWNGSNWSAVSKGLNEWVNALAVAGSNVYAAGRFTMADGVKAGHIAKWDGNQWSTLGAGITGGEPTGSEPLVSALLAVGGDLYVGGWFTRAGGGKCYQYCKMERGQLVCFRPRFKQASSGAGICRGTIVCRGRF